MIESFFRKLILAINQAELSWQTILNKSEAFEAAYEAFVIEKVANFKEEKINELMENQRIIRNRRKIEAAVVNAKAVQQIQKEFGCFSDYLWSFSGAEVVNEELRFVKKLKKHSTDTVWIVGGGKLLKPLIENHLIDEWSIQIAPVILGEGKRLFQEGNYEERLKLVDTKYFGEFIELHYVKK